MFGSYLESAAVGLKTPTRPSVPSNFLPQTPSTPSSTTFSPHSNGIVPSSSSPFSSGKASDSPSSLYPWNWNEKALDLASPVRGVYSTPERHSQQNQQPSQQIVNKNGVNDSGKRGRPRADVISHLILEGSSSPSGIKCRVCSRVFPREKSLQAHLRTHTGERPYNCDYPGCNRAFTQSGQLKTHQRLHAGEKPFICSSPGCNNRYTHANRTCPAHPYHKPQRSSDLILQPVLSSNENSDAVMIWLENYRRDRQEKTPGKTISVDSTIASSSSTMMSPPVEKFVLTENESFKRVKTKRGLELDIDCSSRKENSVLYDVVKGSPENRTPAKKFSILEERLASPRKTLGDITKQNDLNVTSPISSKVILSPQSTSVPTPPSSSSASSTSFKLKKRWLKEAFQDEEKRRKPSVETEDLALPIRWTSDDEQQRRSPKSMVVAKALVELSSSPTNENDQQPLNLSLSGETNSSYL